MATLYAVIFDDRGEETEHSAHATMDAAKVAGAALARQEWAKYQTADGTNEPFPDVADEWEAMDSLRTRYPVRLEVEEIEIGDDVIRSLFLAVGNRFDAISSAIGDAYAYRTDSGEIPENELEDHDSEKATQYRALADELGMRVSPIHFS